MPNTETTITVDSQSCEYACLKAIEYHEKQVETEWNLRIQEEMNKKQKKFLFWVTETPAKTREEAIQRIKDDFNSPKFAASFRKPGMIHEERIKGIKVILGMCQRSDAITLSKKDYNLIGFALPKTSERSYRR
jgi:hypothetical protein